MRRTYLNKEQFDNVITFFCFLFCFAFLGFALWLFRAKETIVTQIITAVIALMSGIAGFRWGSSRNANRKDETIDQLLTPNPGSTTVTTTQTNPDDNKNKPLSV